MYIARFHRLISLMLFLFNDPAPTEIYTLSLHDALPISGRSRIPPARASTRSGGYATTSRAAWTGCSRSSMSRSEEHTSELQSRFDLVCRLLLEKKKN